MQIAYHIGAHVTDEDRLLRCLLKNTERLRKDGIIVPGPSRYRRFIRETVTALSGAEPSQDAREIMLDSIVDEDDVKRLVLSAENFTCVPKRIMQYNEFYAVADNRLPTLARLLPAEHVEFHLATRNPATFVPALMRRANAASIEEITHGADLRSIFWSDVIRRIRTLCPDVHLVVWANEDSPLIWSDILSGLAGLPQNTAPLIGADDLLGEIMSAEGMQRYQAYMQANPQLRGEQKTKVITAFLDKYALPDQIEEELDLPGWTPELVEQLTTAYEDDLDRIAAMSDVDVILP